MFYDCDENRTLSRRRFLLSSGASLAALGFADPLLRSIAAAYGQSSGGTGNLLVLCQLAGGMDSLSFLAPVGNSVYRERRPNLALTSEQVFALPGDANIGISQHFPFMNELYTQDQLAIVQQVAYPDGNGSHFESQEVYEYGVRNLGGAQGRSTKWYERLRKTYFDEPYGVLDTQTIGDPRRYGYPDRTYRQAAQEAFGRLAKARAGGTAAQRAVRERYAKIDEIGAMIRERTEAFDSTGDATGAFFRAAALASAGLGTQIIKLTYGGFDTHANQAEANASLFPRIDAEFQQFAADAQALGIWERTCVVFYTEFGRRNAENASPGTDHGYGCHMILAGPGINGGLHGQNVSSSDLREDNLPYYVDFRAVFGAAIRDWLGFDPDPIFNLEGETFSAKVGSTLFR